LAAGLIKFILAVALIVVSAWLLYNTYIHMVKSQQELDAAKKDVEQSRKELSKATEDLDALEREAIQNAEQQQQR
jgi:uncharacterized membrane-anchored protein YhcB (DUF1043 family)